MTHPLLVGDHHVHSTFSDDASSSLADNVASAHAVGLERLVLADHVRRDTTWVPDLVTAARALSIPDGLTVHIGVEAKVLDSAGALDLPRLPDGVDTILIADHQFPGPHGPLTPAQVRSHRAAGLSVDDTLDLLVTGLNAAMQRHPGNQLAHCFSILPKVGLEEAQLGSERLRSWAETAAATDTTVEINEKWSCPGSVALTAARAAGVVLVASTDSHHARDVGRYERVASILRGLDGSVDGS